MNLNRIILSKITVLEKTHFPSFLILANKTYIHVNKSLCGERIENKKDYQKMRKD